MKSWSLAEVRSHLQRGRVAETGHPESPLGTVISISVPSPQPFFFYEEGTRSEGPWMFSFFSMSGGHCPFHARKVMGAADTELLCEAFD